MIRVFAPAKINLYLHVTGHRSDGYHLLDSLIVFANVGDVVEVDRSSSLSLEVKGPFGSELSSNDEENLILRAARLLSDSVKIAPKAAIRLTKNLPLAAGIGGGSADCAAAIKALIEHWHLSPPDHELRRLAVQLGADIPVCLEGRPSYVGGIGEIITPAPILPPAWLVLVNPATKISTSSIFQAHTAPLSNSAHLIPTPNSAGNLARELSLRRNDLTNTAAVMEPAIINALEALESCKSVLISRMSGSGATCFGLFEYEEQASASAKKIQKLHPHWWVKSTRILGPDNEP